MNGSPAAISRADAALRVHAEAVTTAAALQALAPEWQALAAACAATPFQSPQWLLPWWQHVGRGELASVAVRSAAGGELVGLAPLYLFEGDGSGLRKLFPIGIATTDVLDVLVRPGWQAAVLATVWDQLQAWAGLWDVLEFPQLRPGAALLGLQAPAGWRIERVPGEPNPVLSGPVSRSMAQNLRTARTRAARTGRLEFARVEAGGLDGFLDRLVHLHGRRWSERGEAGVLDAPPVQAWHRAAMPQLQQAGLLRAWELRLDGTCLAAMYALADAPGAGHRRAYYYIGGFDPAHAALSPGTLLIGHAIEAARAEGLSAFDFLRGAEPYKYRWGAVDQPMLTLRLRREGD
jgi:CelD/BcsL family acetyltransferase involved in cellulose biosynthesis